MNEILAALSQQRQQGICIRHWLHIWMWLQTHTHARSVSYCCAQNAIFLLQVGYKLIQLL